MDKTNIDYMLDIFRTLTGDLPQQMLYRENGDSIELKNLDSTDICPAPDMMSGGWSLISGSMAGAA